MRALRIKAPVCQSRAQRDEINAKVMADPRLKAEMSNMPFDGKRMIYGGFETFSSYSAPTRTKRGQSRIPE